MAEKKSAAFFCDTDSVSTVFTEDTIGKISELFDLDRTVRTSRWLRENPGCLRNTEYLFSTWGMPQLKEDEIAAELPELKAVFYGAGSVQNFARPFLNRGVRVFSAWSANAVPVAEFAAAQIILAAKGYFQCVDRGRRLGREAAGAYFAEMPGNYRIRVGILGAGQIGRMVMKDLSRHDLEVLAYDPYISDETLKECGAVRAGLPEIFSQCQVISCHIANLPATVGMLSYPLFSSMKKNATFVNTGRGAQVVEADLIRALREEPGRTALLDVTFPEPPEEGSPLCTLPNVFLTPHIAGSAGQEVARMGRLMQEEAGRFLRGEPCSCEVFPAMLKTMA